MRFTLKTKLSKFVLLFASVIACNFTPASAEENYNGLPLQFFVKQHWFSWTNTFDIESKDSKYGVVHRKLFSWTPEYHFYDLHEQVQAKAKMSFFSFGAVFDITDGFDYPLGKVEERIFTFFPTFDIYRPDGYHVAKASLNFWGTTYTVMDPQTDEVIAILWRNFFRLKDNWTIDIVKPEIIFQNNLDPRMFVLVMAFQSDRDYWKRLKDDMDNTLRSPHANIALNDALEHHQLVLEGYRESLSEVTPTQKEISALEVIVKNSLAALIFDENNISTKDARIEILDKSLTVLMPLFESNELSLGQKKALFLVIKNELN